MRQPLIERRIETRKSSRVSKEKGSRESAPARTLSARAASSTVRLIGPSKTKGVSPPKAFGRIATGTRPNEALKPTTLHQAEGMRIEPPASVPSASGTSPSATAAALPPDEPPVFLRVSNGLRDGPKR